MQGYENYLVVKERFTKYDIGKDKTSAQFFSIGVDKLLGPDELLLEKDLMILVSLSGVVSWKKKDFKTLSFRYVMGDFFASGILFSMLGSIFANKMSKIVFRLIK